MIGTHIAIIIKYKEYLKGDDMQISVCGIACEKCPRMQKGICPNGIEGCTPKLTGPCKIKHCAVKKKVRYCFECKEFPCDLTKVGPLNYGYCQYIAGTN